MNRIIEWLREKASEKSKAYPDDRFLIRGLWRIDYLFRSCSNARSLAYTCLLAQTLGHGFCYCEVAPVLLDRSLIGKDARKVRPRDIYTEIVLLDAIYSVFEKRPEASLTLEGHPDEKAIKRTRIVIDEALKELRGQEGRKHKVVNIGVFPAFVRGLRERGIEVYATDRDPNFVGKMIEDVKVESGRDKTLDRVEECDLALVTGMTLSTQTLEDIIDMAKKHGTKVVMFAETGANFAEEYCNTFGVDVVVSESFPFYWCPGRSTIDIYRG